MSVGANEGAAKNPGGPKRDVVPLQGFQQRQLDFGLLGDRDESNCLFFTPLKVSAMRHTSASQETYERNVALRISREFRVVHNP